jgi:hypothetical protein
MHISPELVAVTQTSNELAQSFMIMPDRLADPYALVGGAIATGALATYLWIKSRPGNYGYAHNPSNPGLVREAVIDIASGEDRNDEIKDRWYRVGAPFLAGVGAIGLAAAALSGPSFQAEQDKPGANTVLAIETSWSSLYTNDMPGGNSRFGFAKSSIENSQFSGNMAVVQYGLDTQTTVALQPFDSNKIEANVQQSPPNNFNTDGNNLPKALDTAGSNLPNHKGNVVVITDAIGANFSSSETVSQAVTNLNNEGINTRIVVIGTNGSHYSYHHGSPEDATPQLGTLSGVNPNDIVFAKNARQVESSIHSAIGQPIKVKQEKFWIPAIVPGALALASGLFLGIRQRVKKVI